MPVRSVDISHQNCSYQPIKRSYIGSSRIRSTRT